MERFSRPGRTTYFARPERDFALGLELMRALRRGEIVALQGDRPRAGGQNLAGTLLGQPFVFPAGPLVLARSTAVPVLPVFVFREGRRRYCIVLRRSFTVPRTADRQADLRGVLPRIAADVEWAIRRRPYQWFCFRSVAPGARPGLGPVTASE
jgi:lauroyl/myristoyl acyltransferase